MEIAVSAGLSALMETPDALNSMMSDEFSNVGLFNHRSMSDPFRTNGRARRGACIVKINRVRTPSITGGNSAEWCCPETCSTNAPSPGLSGWRHSH